MKKILAGITGVALLALLCAMVLAQQNNNAPAVEPQAGQSGPLVDQSTSSQPDPGRTGLSKRNKMKLDQAEQRKLRQAEIDKERAAAEKPQ